MKRKKTTRKKTPIDSLYKYNLPLQEKQPQPSTMTPKIAALEKMKATISHLQTQKISIAGFFASLLSGLLHTYAGVIVALIFTIIIAIKMINTNRMLHYLSNKYQLPLPQKNKLFTPQPPKD